jgi:hypothetical protein
MTAGQPTKAFYYPHVAFGSAAWLKSALLYWEGVVRHIREPVEDHDPEVRALVEAGLIEDVLVWPYWDKIAPVFGERLERLLRECGRMPAAIPGTTEVRGHTAEQIEQYRARLIEQLQAAGCRRAAEALRTHLEQTLTIYGVVAAEIIARDRDLAPVTDDPIFLAMSTHGQDAEAITKSRPVEEGAIVAELLIPTPSIDAAAALPVPRLLELRKALAKHRRAFREKVEAEANAIAGLPSADAVKHHVQSFARHIHANIEAQRREMRRHHVQGYFSFLRIVAPVSMAAGLAMSAAVPLAGPIGTIGGAAIEATSWYLRHRGAAKHQRHYMLAVEDAMKGTGVPRGALQSGLDRLLGRGPTAAVR